MRHLLLTATVVASLAVPALALAEPHHDHHGGAHHRAAAAQHHRHAVHRHRHEARVDQRHDRHYRNEARVDHRQDHVRVVAGGRDHWDRANPNWWRGRPEFAGFAGRRPGFWFRPGFGYVRPDPRWAGYSWRVGGFVPAPYRGWAVANPYFYGLAPARPGFRYVYLDNNIVLMAVATGLIAQVLPNVY